MNLKDIQILNNYFCILSVMFPNCISLCSFYLNHLLGLLFSISFHIYLLNHPKFKKCEKFLFFLSLSLFFFRATRHFPKYLWDSTWEILLYWSLSASFRTHSLSWPRHKLHLWWDNRTNLCPHEKTNDMGNWRPEDLGAMNL